MEKVIKIGTKDVALQANAATPIRFRNIFGKDLLTIVSEGTSPEGIDMKVASEVAPELAFIMAKSAEKADMTKLNEAKMIEWLEQFEPMDLINATDGIFSVYFGDSETEVEAKKNSNGEPKEN
jgi:hypothetical protein